MGHLQIHDAADQGGRDARGAQLALGSPQQPRCRTLTQAEGRHLQAQPQQGPYLDHSHGHHLVMQMTKTTSPILIVFLQ